MKNILIVVGNNIEMGGVETYIVNVLRKIDLSNYEIDIMVPGKIINYDIAHEINKMGCNFIELDLSPNSVKRILLLNHALEKYLQVKQYDIIHINTGSVSVEAICLRQAKLKGIKRRIAHSHSVLPKVNFPMTFIRNFCRFIINKNCTDKLACSMEAGISLFGSNNIYDLILANNGIDTSLFRYDKNIRKATREEEGWKNTIIVGTVGRLAYPKNQMFLIDIMDELTRIDEKYKMVIVGDGPDRQIIEKKILNHNLNQKVILMGVRNDIPRLMQGFDLFILPSIKEGLGIVNIEAQSTGLYCLVSDSIPRNVNITGNVFFLPLSASAASWGSKIDELCKKTRNRVSCHLQIEKSGYGIDQSAKVIEQVYNAKLDEVII